MSKTTDDLITRLASGAEPVRRLRPPLARAALWLAGAAVAGGLVLLYFWDPASFAERTWDAKLMVEVAATLVTGVAAVVAAFYLSLPDRSSAWALLPLPPFALWLGTSGYSCYRNWIDVGVDGTGWDFGETAFCFGFILAVSVPLGLTLLVLLRRARPLAPARVAALGGLGVAGISAFLLQFLHPFDVTFLDLAVHLVAVGIVVGAASLSGVSAGRSAEA